MDLDLTSKAESIEQIYFLVLVLAPPVPLGTFVNEISPFHPNLIYWSC